MSSEFRQKLIKAYQSNKEWRKVKTMLETATKTKAAKSAQPRQEKSSEEGLPPPGFRFFLRDELIYFKDQHSGAVIRLAVRKFFK
jgi:hypothetical protein